ncbi:MAG: hypothetical protein NTY61_02250, partial [Candidatus Parcubacteria bacterium]|nr:hypothetical protein [Candidatus Parcubacteria bacterium]
ALAILAVVTLLTYQTMWISGIVLNKSWLYLVVTDLLIVELFWASVFLPNTYYVKALLIVVAYYLLVNLSRNHLLGLLTKTMVWRYLVIGGIILGVVLGTAQWL